MKRKLTALLLAAMLLLSACGASDSSAGTGASSSETSAEETSAASSVPSSASEVEGGDDASVGPYYDTSGQDLTMPDFELTNNLDETTSFSDYKGKVVVMNFWASWCPPCIAEMPDFQELYELSEEENFVLLMMNQLGSKESETKEQVEAFLSSNQFTFPVIYDEQWQVAYDIFGMSSIPFTVVVNEEGKVSRYTIGTTTKKTVLKMIEEARNA